VKIVDFARKLGRISHAFVISSLNIILSATVLVKPYACILCCIDSRDDTVYLLTPLSIKASIWKLKHWIELLNKVTNQHISLLQFLHEVYSSMWSV
jgi:hypothetical protein